MLPKEGKPILPDVKGSMNITNAVPLERLKVMFPGGDDDAYVRLSKRIGFCLNMQPVQRQGNKINETRLFAIATGKVALSYYRGNVNDHIFKSDLLIQFAEIDAGLNTYIPISLNSDLAPFSIVSLADETIVIKTDQLTYEMMLESPTVSKHILKVQGDLIAGMCRNYPQIYRGPAKMLIPLFQVMGQYVKNNSKARDFLVVELGRVLAWINDLNISGDNIYHFGRSPKELAKLIVLEGDKQAALLDTLFRKLLSTYVKLRFFDSKRNEVAKRDSPQTVEVLEETIELLMNRFIIDLSKTK